MPESYQQEMGCHWLTLVSTKYDVTTCVTLILINLSDILLSNSRLTLRIDVLIVVLKLNQY